MRNYQPHPSYTTYRVLDPLGRVVYIAANHLQADHFVQANPNRGLTVISPGGRDVTGRALSDQRWQERSKTMKQAVSALTSLLVTVLVVYLVIRLLVLDAEREPPRR